jgi:hypothetical protein
MSDVPPLAYSHLPEVLAKSRLKISDLHEKLKAIGFSVNQKSLYRLTSAKPLLKIDTRIVGAICQTCAVGIQDVISFEQPKAVLEKLSLTDQNRLNDLMTRHSERKLNGEELKEFDKLSDKAHQLTMANARILVAQRRTLNAAQQQNGSVNRRAVRKHPRSSKQIAAHH